MLHRLILALCILAAAGSASARDCNAGNLNQTEMNQCAVEAYDKADALLNARFKKIVGCLKDEAATLVEAQRAWIKFRDAECKFQVGRREDGGSSWPMVMDGCLQSVTEERSKGLDYYLTCKEGDLSCPTFNCGFRK